MKNKPLSTLVDLGICDADALVPFWPRVRDRDDVAVLRCAKSGVLVLSRSDHVDLAHYEEQAGFSYWGPDERRAALRETEEDDDRRARQFGDRLRDRVWLDVGAGAGGLLQRLGPSANAAVAVEPQADPRKWLAAAGYEVFRTVDEISRTDFDIATLFHVLEHMVDPLGALVEIRQRLKPGGELIIEVPHARDFLIAFLDLPSFKNFTFWSEHLVLHTRESLRRLLEAAGYHAISVEGLQRYPLANHMHWLAHGLPAGHKTWDLLRTADLDAAYAALLDKLDHTDSLVATARA